MIMLTINGELFLELTFMENLAQQEFSYNEREMKRERK